jgi:vancomycin permeability regulator SanA
MKGDVSKILAAGVIELAVWFFGHTAVIVTEGLRDKAAASDVAVVMGTGLREDGQASPRLLARIEAGYEVWKDGLAPVLVVSGASYYNGWNEAAVMRDKLVEMGVPMNAIVADSNGNTSYDTARNVSALMRERGWTSVIVVSQYFHIVRTDYAFKRFGVENVGHVHAKYFGLRDIWSIAREFPAFYFYIFKDYRTKLE